MRALLLTKNECKICGVMLALLLVFAGGFSAVAALSDATPYQLCPARVSIMSTTGADIRCN